MTEVPAFQSWTDDGLRVYVATQRAHHGAGAIMDIADWNHMIDAERELERRTAAIRNEMG